MWNRFYINQRVVCAESIYTIRVEKVTGIMDDLSGASHETDPLRQAVNQCLVFAE